MTDSGNGKMPEAPRSSRFIALLAGMACAALGWWLCVQSIGFVSIDSPKGLCWTVVGTTLLLPGLVYLSWSFDRRKPRLAFKLTGWLIGLFVPPAAYICLVLIVLPGVAAG